MYFTSLIFSLYPTTEYVTDGSILESVNEEKDLGVIISEDLKWDKQCSAAVSKANKILGMIKRSFSVRSREW